MQDMRVPEAARLEDARQRAAGATGAPRGFYYRGTVYLVANGLGSVRDVAETLFHEALGHYGLRAVFGSALDGILDQIAVARPDLMRSKANEYGKDLKALKQRREVAEEVLAEMAQTKPNLGFVKRAIAAIRTWLRQNVPYFKDLALTDDEIIRNYVLPARNWVERGERADGSAPDIRFSRSPESSAGLPDTIEVDGVQRPTRNSAGQPIHPTEEGIRNFWRWFGDSKVVDERGRPLVMYHGTTRDFSAFDPNAPRTALPLPGIFFTPHAAIAEIYASFGKEIRDDDGFIIGAEGGNVMPVYLSLQNPARLKYDDRSSGKMTSYKVVEADMLDALNAGHDGVIIEGWETVAGQFNSSPSTPSRSRAPSATAVRSTRRIRVFCFSGRSSSTS
jgi:hypothetical protein